MTSGDVERERDIRVEVDADGLSAGVEQESPDGEITAPFDPEKIDVQTRTTTVDLLLARLRRGVLDLTPEFQRRSGIWTNVNQSKLIESLLLRIPLPTLYAAEEGLDSWVIVDGVQRLTTIARFVEPSSIGQSEPLRLTGLQYLQQYDGLTYHELPPRLQIRINETELVINLMRSGTPEEVVFNIFARINTGGTPLSRQELRHALIPGPARQILGRLAGSEPYLAATARSVSPNRMADREMVLRFLAFTLTDPREYPRGDLDAFLRDAMHRINELDAATLTELENEFDRAMSGSLAIFGEHAFRKRFRGQSGRNPVNKALFEVVAVNVSKFNEFDLLRLVDRKDALQERFLGLMENAAFQQTISQGTGDVTKVHLRFDAVRAVMEEELDR